MTHIFLKLCNMSLAAGWIVLAVVLFRAVFRKAPKWIRCLLWGMVALRLLIPTFAQSSISLLPSAQVIPHNIAYTQTPAIYSGITAVNNAVNPMLTQHMTVPGTLEQILQIAAIVWVVGVGLMLLYSAVSWLRLHRQVRVSLRHSGNVYLCDDLQSPFVLGVFRPRIYVPSGMEENAMQYVLAHENAHVQRRDHWWKPLGFLLLSIHWFNPLLWVAYILLCRDIENACDERVLTQMGQVKKLDYAKALAQCSVHRRMILACPVAFGEVSVASRIKNILNYKKPGFWVILLSVVAYIILMGCCLTDPLPCLHDYTAQTLTPATCAEAGFEKYTCRHCEHSYTAWVPMLEHQYDPGVVAQPSTCTQKGRILYTCFGCGAQKQEETDMLSHTAGQTDILSAPNCTQTGEAESICAVCGGAYRYSLPQEPDVHIFKRTAETAATCTQSGFTTDTCTLCGYTQTVTLEKLGHSYKTTITKEPRCFFKGVRKTYCLNCEKSSFEQLDPTNDHDFVEYARYKKCRDCGWSIDTPSKPAAAPLIPTSPVIQWDVNPRPSDFF